MPDQDQNVTNQDQPPVTDSGTTAPAQTQDDKRFSQAEVDQIIKARLADEKRKSADVAERARQQAEAEAAAKNGEWEKLAKQREVEAEELKGRLAEMELSNKRRAIADKIGLPSPLADRLKGTTDEELEADAKALLEVAKVKTAPNTGATNPGNTKSGETDADRRRRLIG